METYSACVEFWLIIGEQSIPLAQLGPSFAILKNDFTHEPTTATIEVFVDGNLTNTYRVLIKNGIEARRFEFEPCPTFDEFFIQVREAGADGWDKVEDIEKGRRH